MENIEEALKAFINEDGKVTDYPGKKKRALRPLIYEHLASKFELGKNYTEPEVNAILKSWLEMEDYVIWRREMIEANLLARTPDCRSYYLVKYKING